MTALQQSPEFARALSAIGVDVQSRDPVVLRRKIPVLGDVAFASRIPPERVSGTQVRVLNGETPCPQPYRAAGFHQIITPAHIAEWDLTPSDLRPAMHGKWRNRLTQGERNRIRVRDVEWLGQPHPMFTAADALARARRFKQYPFALLSAYAQTNPKSALLFEAFEGGTVVAACLILRHGATATYQTAWSTPRGAALQAPRIVLFSAATRMAALGHTCLDLGAINTDHARGLARFKLGTGARVRKLGGTWVRFRSR